MSRNIMIFGRGFEDIGYEVITILLKKVEDKMSENAPDRDIAQAEKVS